jgi:hypothetical protein
VTGNAGLVAVQRQAAIVEQGLSERLDRGQVIAANRNGNANEHSQQNQPGIAHRELPEKLKLG